MSYQQLSQPGHRLLSRQYCHTNTPEIFEEPDSFIHNVSFSESDGYIDILPKVRSVPSHDIQELFIRKPMISSSQIFPCAPQGSRCCFNGYWTAAPESMYEHPPVHYAIATGQAIHRRSSSAYIPRCNTSSLPNNFSAIQTRTHQNNVYEDATPFKSAPTIPTDVSEKLSEEANGIQRIKLPASVAHRTSRCMRQAVPHPALKKLNNSIECSSRQSTVDSQKRTLKSLIPVGVSKSQEIRLPLRSRPDSFKCRTLPEVNNGNRNIDVKKMNSEGDATSYNPNVSSLDTIERIVASLDENEVEELSEEHKNEIRRMSKFLAPRVPSSVKSSCAKKQEIFPPNDHNMKNGESVSETGKETEICLKKSLHTILDQLENCEISLNAVRAKYSINRDPVLEAGNKAAEEKLKAEEIFNLREIAAKIPVESSVEAINKVNEEQEITPAENSASDEFPDSSKVIHDTVKTTSNSMNSMESKSSLDDVSAIELHRSKSYIVNLIDKALSKELGTIPKERTDRDNDGFQDLNTVRAINQIKKNCKMNIDSHGTMQRITNDEIDLIISPTDLSQHQKALSNVGEPAYIKKLKELRWGHFKHIQQEVRRLEDLERFLDTCGVSCDSSY